MTPQHERALARVAERLAGAERVLFVTGAGISAESGLPTYRGVGGIYEDAVTDEGMPIEEALSGAVFRRDPALSWKYIMHIERACRGARPSRAHQVVAELEGRFEVWVLTQNVDGLHREAGSTRIVDIHGDVRQLLCTSCPHRFTVRDYAGLALPPRCERCGAIVRPDVVLFGEMLPWEKVAALRSELDAGFDAVFSVGTSSLFPYIAEPVVAARLAGALTVEVNPADTAVSHLVDEKLDLRAGVALDALARLL